MPRSLPRWLAIGCLEFLFWGPFCIIPFVAKLTVGEAIWRTDVLSCTLMSAALAVAGSYFGRFQPGYRIVVFPVLALGSLIVTGIVASKQGLLDASAMLAIIDTDASESAEFLSHYSTGDFALAVFLLLPLAALVVQARRGLFLPRLRYAGRVLVALLVVQLGVRSVHRYAYARSENRPAAETLGMLPDDLITYPEHYIPLQPYLAALSAVQMRHQLAALARTASPIAGARALDPAGGATRSYVIVVGESLTRRHMHLYGYTRDTTPALDALAAAGQLLAYRHVVTSHAMTVPALSAAFRFEPGRGQDGHTIFDLLNGAGFKTYWVSNQYEYGLYEAYDSAVSMMTAAASQTWLNQPLGSGGAYAERRNFDADVLPELRKLLVRKEQDKVIFLHLMGSHYYYPSRYPPSYEYFRTPASSGCRSPAQRQTIDEYDDSVRYNDWVIDQIIRTVRAAGDDSFVLYFSDHGEEVYDYRDYAGHTDTMMSPYLAEIPFVLWLSDEYRRQHSEFAARLAEAGERGYITSELLYGIADLARLTFPGMDPARSIFSEHYVERPRIAAGRDYDRWVQSWAPDAAHSAPSRLLDCGDKVVSAPATR
jgi:glucan phosphoethanolaminetransferase (alkaline phosphatase superfamily)